MATYGGVRLGFSLICPWPRLSDPSVGSSEISPLMGYQPLGMRDEWCESCIRPWVRYHTSESIPEQGPSISGAPEFPPLLHIRSTREKKPKENPVSRRSRSNLSRHRSKLEAATTSSRPCSPGGNAENQRARCLAELPRALYWDPLG